MSQKVRFRNPDGQKLTGLLDIPLGSAPLAYAVFAHCFSCTKDVKAAFHISRALTRAGIAVLRFDFTGLGESQGDFADTTFSSNVTDLIAAAGFLAETYEAPQLLVGHSLGGAAVLLAAARIPSVVAVATIAAPAEPGHLKRHLITAPEQIEARGEASISLAGSTFRLQKAFLDDLEATRMQAVIRKLDRALLILHAPLDDIVGIDNAARIFQAARHPKSFISLDNADHLLSAAAESHYAGAVIAAWARKYIHTGPTTAVSEGGQGPRVLVRTGSDGYRTEVLAGGHAQVADEPLAAGGTDRGPTPYDYLLTALGACTSMTLRMYADRKRWPLEAITVGLQHRKVHAVDCRECESHTGMVDRIQREIELSGDLDADQRQRLLEIADRCPVHRTLSAEIQIQTQLSPASDVGE